MASSDVRVDGRSKMVLAAAIHWRQPLRRVEVRDWLEANPRIHVHFTPTSGSWLNLVEVWFGIIERQAIHRGTFRSDPSAN